MNVVKFNFLTILLIQVVLVLVPSLAFPITSNVGSRTVLPAQLESSPTSPISCAIPTEYRRKKKPVTDLVSHRSFQFMLLNLAYELPIHELNLLLSRDATVEQLKARLDPTRVYEAFGPQGIPLAYQHFFKNAYLALKHQHDLIKEKRERASSPASPVTFSSKPTLFAKGTGFISKRHLLEELSYDLPCDEWSILLLEDATVDEIKDRLDPARVCEAFAPEGVPLAYRYYVKNVYEALKQLYDSMKPASEQNPEPTYLLPLVNNYKKKKA